MFEGNKESINKFDYFMDLARDQAKLSSKENALPLGFYRSFQICLSSRHYKLFYVLRVQSIIFAPLYLILMD